MKISYPYIALTAVALSFSSCKNPADETADAKISAEQSALAGQGQKYIFTDTSKIEFTGSKVTGSHSGGFKSFEGHFILSENSETPNAGEFTIDMDSLWSDAEKLTAHLKNADFFDVTNFPKTTFKLTEVKKTEGSEYSLSGNFTLHGVTKNITFPATATRTGDTAKVNAEFDINRKDFGIVYAGRKDDLIRDEVVIRLALEAKAE